MKGLNLFVLTCLVGLVVSGLGNAAEKKVFINEISLGEGWIELYNPGSTDVDLSDCWFDDRAENTEHWKFPAGVKVPAGGYLLVYPDEGTGDTHTNWILETDDTDFGLWGSDKTTVLDLITGALLSEDLSYGRYPDGGDKLGNMEATKGAPNKKIK